jgi:hypothetical protein
MIKDQVEKVPNKIVQSQSETIPYLQSTLKIKRSQMTFNVVTMCRVNLQVFNPNQRSLTLSIKICK